MIDRNLIVDTVEHTLAGTDAFLVEVTIDGEQNIVVTIDSDTGLDIDTCAAVTRAVNAAIDPDDTLDHSLEVGSAGLTAPLRVRRQYEKNIGNELEVLTRDGRKLRGVLSAVDDDPADPTSWTFTLLVPAKVLEEGRKRPVIKNIPETFTPTQVKHAVYLIDF